MPAPHDAGLHTEPMPLAPCPACGCTGWRPTAFRWQCGECGTYASPEHPVLVTERECAARREATMPI